MSHTKGFTLIEVLLSVTLIAILAAFTTPVYLSFFLSNDVALVTSDLASSLRRAQLLSRSGASDSPWGVAIQNQQIILFQGTTYAARDTTFDEITTFGSIIDVTGITEVTFSQLYGIPSTTGATTFTSAENNVSKTITINEIGLVSY